MAGPSNEGDGAASQAGGGGREHGAAGFEELLDQPEDLDQQYATALAALPDHVTLLLRDRIKGLEAAAGSARATAEEVEHERRGDVARLTLIIEGLRAELEQARAEREQVARVDSTQVNGEIVELQAQVADLRAQLDALSGRVSAAHPGEAPWARLLRRRR
jgi:chromosome segregation ATPase